MTSATILGLSGPELTDAERDFFRSADPWGFILFARNVDTPEQLRRLTADLRDCVGRDALITVDQEGGRVQRLRAPHWAEWLPPLDDAGHGAKIMALRYRAIAQELRAVGIDSNCAPTLDIAGAATHPFLQNRCLGRSVEQVITNGRAAAQGMLDAGVLPVIKHMPGHGRAQADSHFDLPVVDTPLDQLIATDFAPFAALADMPLAMTAHIRFTAVDDAPATASAPMIGLIRQQIGFDNLLMTDDISMQALSGSIAGRAAAAIAAGCDVVLHCNGQMPEMEQAVAAAGRLTARAQARADRALAGRQVAPGPDLAATLDAYRAAIG